MSNETDLDWLARNVHVWPAGEHQPWCYVYMTYGGVMKAAGNFLDAVAKPTMITIDQWLSRRAELQNKPSWSKAEEWAGWLAQDSYGCWGFFQKKPLMHALSWIARSGYYQIHSPGNLLLGDWRDTLEKRPEQTIADICREVTDENRHEEIFEPFIRIEDNQEQDMKQDNGWFERGELPPVGEVCEILGAFGHYQEWFECKIIAEHNGSVFAANERSWMNVRKGERQFRPIRTERDVLIEIIKQWDGLVQTDDVLADAILAAGFSLGAK